MLFGGKDIVHSSLVVVVGKTFNYGEINLAINLAYITNPAGNRLAFIFGYAISKSWHTLDFDLELKIGYNAKRRNQISYFIQNPNNLALFMSN